MTSLHLLTKSPLAPMPRDDAAAATTAAMSDMNATGILSLESIVDNELKVPDQDKAFAVAGLFLCL